MKIQPPQHAGGYILIKSGMDHHAPTLGLLNIATSFVTWWQCRQRTVWRITPLTAEYIRSVNLTFLPETSPPSWTGNAILIESTRPEKPLFDDVFSMACYRIPDMTGRDRYFFILLSYPDGVMVFSIATDLFRINQKMAESGEMFMPGWIDDTGLDLDRSVPREKKQTAYNAIRFVFAFSYYVDSPARMIMTIEPGPPVKNERGKVVKKDGQPTSQWRYVTAQIVKKADLPKEERPLDKSNLSLEPVLVVPHIRRRGDKIIIVDQHDSHRWKNPEKIASKISI